MCHFVMLMTLSGVHGPLDAVDEPFCLRDYASAQELGRKEQKPLAVILGSGRGGWRALSGDGRVGPEARRMLSEEYVCVYIDTAEKPGKRLAEALDVAGGPALVLSDRKGEVQAFRHAGKVGNDDLIRYLRRYADRQHVVYRTHSSDEAEGIAYSPPILSSFSLGSC